MPAPTKLELTQTNARLATENAELRALLAQAQADLARVTECASAVNTMRRQRPAYVPPQWQIDRAAAMAAAKAAAIAGHKVVAV